MGMPGLAVPMGNFIPSMVIGSLIGRFLGEVMEGNNALNGKVAHPGVYAMVGSAAMLGGFTHMTIAIVALLTEAGHDISLIPLLMLSIFVAHIFATITNHHGYDEVLIIRKGVPYLDRDPPHELDDPLLTTKSLCMKLPSDAILPPEAAVPTLRKALKHQHVQIFPILKDGFVLGFTTSSRLHHAIPEDYRGPETSSSRPFDDVEIHDDTDCFMGEEDCDLALYDVFSGLLDQEGSGNSQRNSAGSSSRKVAPEDTKSTQSMGTVEAGSAHVVKLKVIMNPVPFEIVEDMPAPLVYSLFSRGIIQVACVVSKEGKFLGILTRSCFTNDSIAQTVRACAAGDGKADDDELRRTATGTNREDVHKDAVYVIGSPASSKSSEKSKASKTPSTGLLS
mmetsp:Transcript_51655/g.82032  ORF Transcript_51655/g.82032 Transcript_51655/m.82032 type:complete len:393 (+) Transcript_51655:70-1248(+)